MIVRVISKKEYKKDYGEWTDFTFVEDLPRNKKLNQFLKLDKDDFVVSDFETSHIDTSDTWVYLWGVCVKGTMFVGYNLNTWVRFIKQLRYINKGLVCYFHNLAYDWSYFRDCFGEYSKKHTIFVDNWKPLKVRYGNLEFRCSYLLTNKSLDSFLKFVNNTSQSDVIQKEVGLIDYTEVHKENEIVIEQKQLTYLRGDVVGLYKGLKQFLKDNHDTKSSIPMTSTGFIRRLTKNSFKESGFNISPYHTSLEMLKYQKEIFAGGYTHGNYKYIGKEVKGCIRHRDFESFYPHMLLTQKFPTSEFAKVNTANITFEKLDHEKNCHLMTVKLTNCILKDDKTLAYLSLYRIMIYNQLLKNVEIITDNGKCISVKGSFIYKGTYEDFEIIRKLYDIEDFEIVDCYYAHKDYIPKYLQTVLLDLFYKKTVLKQKLKTVTDDVEKVNMNKIYMESKALLNGVYGMCATYPIHTMHVYDQNDEQQFYTEKSISFDIDKYNENMFLPYSFGLFVTAYARQHLFKTFDIIGHDNIIYSDTDSAFYLSNPKIEIDIDFFNECLQEQSKSSNPGIYNDVKNCQYYIGRFDDEKEDIIRFKFLHAKCYLYETSDNECTSVIAGVKKCKIEIEEGKKVVHYSHEELGDTPNEKFKNFDNGFVFKEFGGTRIHHHAKGNIIVNVQKEISDSPLKMLEIQKNI